MAGIGALNETELHEQIKHLYATEDGMPEGTIDGFVIDVVRENELVEVQTRGFSKLRRKLAALSGRYRFRIVHPIAVETLITKLSETGELISSRRSPRKGRTEEVFREITAIADLLPDSRITVEVLLVRAVETRIDDGRGSWRRRGVSIVARQLGAIVSKHEFRTARHYLSTIPFDAATPFSNADLMQATGLRYRDAQPMTSALRKMGLIQLVDKRGREQVYRRT